MDALFNKRNFFGQHCIFALIPGWGDPAAVGNGPITGGVDSIGQKMRFDVDKMGSSSSDSIGIEQHAMAHLGNGPTVSFVPTGTSDGFRLLRTDDDLGIIFPDKRNLTILSICRPVGDGRISTGSPRLFSKDSGANAVDHDLMIGSTGSGADLRTRIRIGGVVQTVITPGSVLQDDAVQLIAGTVSPSGSNVVVKVHYLPENGAYSVGASSAVAGEYDPRTTTDMGIGATVGSNDNSFYGWIFGVWAFDIALDSEILIREFFHNPWQVFAPQRILIPMTDAAIVIEGEGPSTTVFVTDVNTTESWTDGDTGLIITGTGFV